MSSPFASSSITPFYNYFSKSQEQFAITRRLVRRVSQAMSIRSMASVFLVICLLSVSTPAAPQTIVAVMKESSTSFAFWYNSSGLAKVIQNRGQGNARGQEKQADRDAKISRLQISPDNVTIDLGERVRFVAVAFDQDSSPVGGVKIKWSCESSIKGVHVRNLPHGEFEGIAPGSFTIVAQAGVTTAQVTVVVRPGVPRNMNLTPTGTRQVSTRDLPNGKVSSIKPQVNTKASIEKKDGEEKSIALVKRAHSSSSKTVTASAAIPYFVSNGWDSSNYWSADDPGNGVGNPPGSPMDGGAGSGNFQFAAPILSLPGRGINISLGLAYNSRLWNKADSQINYDNDRGWPSPGFNLGFGKMLGIGVYTGCMLEDADGTRHGYTGNITLYNWGTHGVMHTTDGSFIDYEYWTGTNGVITWGQARLPNGTTINYGAYSQAGGGVFPTSIEDANGNDISITYVNNAGPRIQVIYDTLGRTVNFYYDSNNLLTAITAPGYNGGSARTLARLHYQQLSLSYSFSGLTVSVPNSYPWVVDAIYYPGTSTGYWLHDLYSTYGMLAQVIEERGMGFSASSLTDMGSVSEGSRTRMEIYNYPLYVGDPNGTQSSYLTDAPTYTSMTERWTRDGSTTMDEAVTSYDVHENDDPRTTTITLPNGTKSKQYSYKAPGQYNDGLVFEDRTFTTDENNPFQKSTSTWEQGAYNSPRPTRVTKTDELNQTTAADFIYGSVYNQVMEIRDYDYGGSTMLRSTHTSYQNSSSYTSRHIFNLPLSVEVYAADNTTRVSRTDYQYDGQTLTDAPSVVMHNDASNPYAQTQENCDWVCHQWDEWWVNCVDWEWDCTYYNPYNPATDYRGNVTQVTTYGDAVGLTSAVTETRRYDIAGNMVKASTSCCEQTTFNYTNSTQYAYPESKTRGSATDPYAQVTTSATYDFNTGLGVWATDANGRASTTDYDANTLRPMTVSSASGSHTDYSYDDAGLSVTQTTYLEAHPTHTTMADKNVKLLNGHGQVRQEQARAADESGQERWDYVDTVFDNTGQVIKQTRPYRYGTTPPNPSLITYDALGRTIKVIAPDYTQADGSDGSTTLTFYNEATRPSVASTNQGETTLVRDPWGRERWGRSDSSGRLVEVVEPDTGGNGSVASNGMLTNYSYNTLGNLTTINSMAGTQVEQTRSFKYDSLGRLTAQKLAEASATLNDSGTYWSDVFTYDDRSNLTSRTDARGVKTNYNYNSDPLNRLQSISWDTTNDPNHSLQPSDPNYYLRVLDAATVSYTYRTKTSPSNWTDVTQLASVTTSGVSTESYAYDSEGRVYTRTLTLSTRSSYPFETQYNYDATDRITNVLYPVEYGNGSQPRKTVHHDYDIASRLSELTYDSQSFASNIVYNAASQTTSLSVGAGTNQVSESYTYSAQTGLLDSQSATRSGSTLLNLSYDYTNSGGRRSGQLTKVSNNQDHSKDRGYEYDALGRLQRATGGQNVSWVQRYQYDRYGNRNNAFSYTASDYVKNFYRVAHDTTTVPDNWVQSKLSTLQSAYAQGPSQFLAAMQSIGEELFSSTDYANRGQNDHEYVHDLYKAYLQREPDTGGWQFWEQQVGINGRAAVRAGFAWSYEFWLKVNGTSPYTPPAGVTVSADGLQGISFDSTSNRINVSGFAYDAAGNQVRALIPGSNANSQFFQYDAANRPAVVRNDNKTVLATYTYGSSNERLIADDVTLRTYYVSQGGTTIAEYTESGGSTTPSWAKSYVYLGARLLSTLTPNGTGENVQYHHPDRLGTRIVTNAQDTTFFEQQTLPFGTALDESPPTGGTTGATNRRFTSYDRSDATKLDYAVNRHYDPQQGRFTQVDPIGMKAVSPENPQTLNLYTYVQNDPVNHTDPDGLFSWKKFFKALLLVHTFGLAGLLAFKSVRHAVVKFIHVVAQVAAKILNNRWVRIGVFIASFLIPFVGPALAAVLKTALHIFNIISDIVQELQLADMLLQHKYKEFGLSIAIGLVSATISVIADDVIEHVKAYLKGGFRWKDLFQGAWDGLTDGLQDVFGRGWQNLIPVYGKYCGPGASRGGGINKGEGINGFDKLCRTHDSDYVGANNKARLTADKKFVAGLFTAITSVGVGDIVFAGHPSGGNVYRLVAFPGFGGLIVYRKTRP